MAQASQEVVSTSAPRRAKRAALNVAWLLLVAVVLEFLLMMYRKYGHPDPGSYSIFWSRREWLWAHLAGGTLTVLLGPLQFLTRLRGRYPRFHRWTGRVYLLAMGVACIGAAGLIATTPGGPGLQVAFAATELAWLFTAFKGFVAIRRKLPQAHRRWMIRNYIITFVFITFRAAILVPGMMTLAPANVLIPTLLWLGWVVPLSAHEAGVAIIARARRPRTPGT